MIGHEVFHALDCGSKVFKNFSQPYFVQFQQKFLCALNSNSFVNSTISTLLLGINFDAQGFAKQWFHWNTLQFFQNRTQCLADQYSQIRDSEFALKRLNGSKMLKENMADNDGIRATYYAYKEREKNVGTECTRRFGSYTNDQLFFISQALVSLLERTSNSIS